MCHSKLCALIGTYIKIIIFLFYFIIFHFDTAENDFGVYLFLKINNAIIIIIVIINLTLRSNKLHNLSPFFCNYYKPYPLRE